MENVLAHFPDEKSANELVKSHIQSCEFKPFREYSKPPTITRIEKFDTVFEWEEVEEYESYTNLLDGIEKKRRKRVLGVAHTYIFDEGKWWGHYPYSAMNPVPIEEYIGFLKVNSGEEEDVEW
jgi:hypothetical protein